jgi:hypothetical protein
MLQIVQQIGKFYASQIIFKGLLCDRKPLIGHCMYISADRALDARIVVKPE